jgi:hypothetical protein
MAPWRKKGTSSSKSFPRAQFQPASGRVCALGGPLMQPARPVCSQICIHVSRFSFSTREFRPQKNVYINIYVCLSWGVGGSWKSAWSAGCIPFFTWPSILPAVEKERERWKRERETKRDGEKKSLKEKLLSCLLPLLLFLRFLRRWAIWMHANEPSANNKNFFHLSIRNEQSFV